MNCIELKVVEEDPGIYILTINRPEVKNALNRQVIQELTKVIRSLEGEGKARVVILQGKERNFAAGADIQEMCHADIEEIDRITEDVHSLHTILNNSPIIFIAAIDGYCLGGGFELALASDIRIASPFSVFGLPKVKLGILPGGWGTQKFLSLTNSSFAMKYILTGDLFNSEKALSLGLISDVDNSPLEESLRMAKQIASNSQTSVRSIKKLLTGIEYVISSERYELERTAFTQLFRDGEAREGLLAFSEKRKPNYKKA